MANNGNYTSEGSKSWIDWLIRYKKRDYGDKFTRDIYKPNAFSSSTLAFSIEKQVNWKLGLKEEEPLAERMFAGTAIHAFLQSKLSETWICDHEFQAKIPYEWKSLPMEKEIIVICHPDGYSIELSSLIELKTSFGKESHPRIGEHMLRQAAFYWYVIKTQLGIDLKDVRVVKLWNEGINEFTLKPDEKELYSKDMVTRALECARRLDGVYFEKGVPQLDNPTVTKGLTTPPK